MKKILLIIIGFIALFLGTAGIFLPVLPTTPFLLLSASCFLRSSDKFYRWLVQHKVLGNYIRHYLEHKAVSVKAKIMSISLLWIVIGANVFFWLHILWLQVLLVLIGVGATVYLLSIKTLTKAILTEATDDSQHISAASYPSIKKKKITTLLLIPLGFLFTVFLLELILQLFQCKPSLRQAWYLADSNRIPDKEIIMINPKLLVDGLYKRRQDTVQIVSLGDSFTEGYPVSDEQSYPAMLKKFLYEKNIRVDVINAGIGNTGPDQHLKLFTSYIMPKTKPDILIWQLYANDIWDNVLYPVYSLSTDNNLVAESGESHWLYIRQQIFKGIPLPVDLKMNSALISFLLKATERLEGARIPKEYKHNPEVWGIRKLKLEIEKMIKFSREYEFTLFFYIIVPQAVYLAEEANHPNKWENNWAYENYNQIYDMLKSYPHFIETKFNINDLQYIRNNFRNTFSTASLATTLFSDGTRDVNPPGDRHLNEYGYWLLGRKIGAHILRYIQTPNSLPQ